MPKYVIFYHGGMPKTRQEAEKSRTKWNDWFKGLGTGVVDRGAPAKSLKKVAKSAGSAGTATSASGYSIIMADSEAAAMAIAESCPIHSEGGSVEIARFVDLR